MFLILPCVILLSCTNSGANDDVKEILGTDEITQSEQSRDNDLLFSSESKYSRSDLVQKLYLEALTKNEDLRVFHQKINSMDQKIQDSTALFNQYATLNEKYFSTVKTYIPIISDSVLQQKLYSIFKEFERKHNANITSQSSLLSDVYNSSNKLRDRHTILKLLTTIKQMEEYQSKKLPEKLQLENIHSDIENLIKEIEKKIDLD